MRTQKIEDLTLSWNPPSGETQDSESSGYYDVITSTNKPTTRYFYDGQMAMEDDYTHHVGGADQVDVTRYGLGARGIDQIEKTTDAYGSSPVTTVSYPIVDGHGNMVRTLSRNGSGYSVTAERIFGAWGEVRNGSGPSDSKGKYCANLGHVQDDESGLIYMRARYYEPASGRFLSEDSKVQGINWYTYCRNNPVDYIDESGSDFASAMRQFTALWAAVGGFVIFVTIGVMLACGELSAKSAGTMAKTAIWFYALSNSAAKPDWMGGDGKFFFGTMLGAMASFGISKLIDVVVTAAEAGQKAPGQARLVIGFCTGYSLLLIAELVSDFETNEVGK